MPDLAFGVQVRERVGDAAAELVRVQPRLGAEDSVGGVRDQHRVVVGQQRAVVPHEVVERRDLLDVRRDVRVVPREVDVVELHDDHVPDRPARSEPATRGRRRRTGRQRNDRTYTGEQQRGRPHARDSPDRTSPGVHPMAPLLCRRRGRREPMASARAARDRVVGGSLSGCEPSQPREKPASGQVAAVGVGSSRCYNHRSMRIVSLVPSATETLFALGLGPDVIAVTHECDYPAAARELPKVTRDVLPSGPQRGRDRRRGQGAHARRPVDLRARRRPAARPAARPDRHPGAVLGVRRLLRRRPRGRRGDRDPPRA